MAEDRKPDFQLLVHRYYRPILYFFRHRGFPGDVCPDLAQETFLRVYRGMESFRYEASEKTWLFRIATHVGLNAVREGRAVKRSGFAVPLEEAFEAERAAPGLRQLPRRTALQELLDREKVDLVRAALEELPGPMRNCILMYVDQGLTYREIATALQVSETTVKSRIFEARQRLKDRLCEDLGLRDDG